AGGVLLRRRGDLPDHRLCAGAGLQAAGTLAARGRLPGTLTFAEPLARGARLPLIHHAHRPRPSCPLPGARRLPDRPPGAVAPQALHPTAAALGKRAPATGPLAARPHPGTGRCRPVLPGAPARSGSVPGTGRPRLGAGSGGRPARRKARGAAPGPERRGAGAQVATDPRLCLPPALSPAPPPLAGLVRRQGPPGPPAGP